MSAEVAQRFVAESSADLADALKLVAVGVVAGQQVGTPHPGALALAQVTANGHQINGVRAAKRVHVVLFELEPIEGPHLFFCK